MRALLDVNVLIALLDAGHIHHAATMSWLEREIRHGWASCPITQNGCVRIMSQPAYPGTLPAAHVASRLAEAAASPDHEFWPADVNLLGAGIFDWSRVLGASSGYGCLFTVSGGASRWPAGDPGPACRA